MPRSLDFTVRAAVRGDATVRRGRRRYGRLVSAARPDESRVQQQNPQAAAHRRPGSWESRHQGARPPSSASHTPAPLGPLLCHPPLHPRSRRDRAVCGKMNASSRAPGRSVYLHPCSQNACSLGTGRGSRSPRGAAWFRCLISAPPRPAPAPPRQNFAPAPPAPPPAEQANIRPFRFHAQTRRSPAPSAWRDRGKGASETHYICI